jgi:hypothetical protein
MQRQKLPLQLTGSHHKSAKLPEGRLCKLQILRFVKKTYIHIIAPAAVRTPDPQIVKRHVTHLATVQCNCVVVYPPISLFCLLVQSA